MNQTYLFVRSLSDEQKRHFSRSAYMELKKGDDIFAKQVKFVSPANPELPVSDFGLETTDEDDRFLFLYLFLQMKKKLQEKYKNMALFVSYLRHVSFRLVVSAENGVVIRPDVERWGNLDEFKKAWDFLDEYSQNYSMKTWIRQEFELLPLNLAYLASWRPPVSSAA